MKKSNCVFVLVLVLFVGLFFLFGKSSSVESPVYKVEGGEVVIVRKVVMSEANLSVPQVVQDRLEKVSSDGFGRSYVLLDRSELKACDMIEYGKKGYLESERDYYYDLWSAFGENRLKYKENVAVSLSFSVTSREERTVCLSVGANDIVVVYQNEEPIFGTYGYRESRHGHHTFPIRLTEGDCELKVVLSNVNKWEAIPSRHLDDEWSATLELIGHHDGVWGIQKRRNSHPLDTPLVSGLDSLLVEGYWGRLVDVEIFNQSGDLVMRGKTRADSSVEWASREGMQDGPFFGYCVVNSEAAEPIFVAGNQELLEGVLAYYKRMEVSGDVWGRRLEQLFDFEANSFRDVWWARKVLIAFSKILYAHDERSRNVIDRCFMLDLDIHEFRSKLDGTTQIYRVYRNRSELERRKLIVMLPTSPGFLAPYLELMADQQLPERVVGLADEFGFDLLLAGGLNPDRGGYLARYEVQENINDYFERYGRSEAEGVYLVGPCSASLTVLGAMRDAYNFDGAVLWTPVVRRRGYKMDVTKSLLPKESLSLEQTDLMVGSMSAYPTLVYWDTDALGHGNLPGTMSLVDRSRAEGNPIEAKWIRPNDGETLWGPRESISIRDWMIWLRRARLGEFHEDVPIFEQKSRVEYSKSVKQKIIGGFYVTQSFSNSHYSKMWADSLRSYRGEHPVFKKSGEGIMVDFKVLDHSQVLDFFYKDSAGNSVFPDPPSFDMVNAYEAGNYWGFRLNGQDFSRVDVVATSAGKDGFPDVDILLEGACQAALWKSEMGKWRLVQVWL